MAGNTACSDGSSVLDHVSARSPAPATNTTVGDPLPWHSMYIWRPPPISTRPAKSLFLAEPLALGLAASAGTAALSTKATAAASNIDFLNTSSPRFRVYEPQSLRRLTSRARPPTGIGERSLGLRSVTQQPPCQ